MQPETDQHAIVWTKTDEDKAADLNLTHLALSEAGRAKLLTDYQEIDLFRRYERGDLSARDRIVEANMRLVVANAKRFLWRGLEFPDLLQHGYLGLLKSVERYDWRKGFRYSTYATWWVRQSISRAVADEGRTIRVPVHEVVIVNKVRALIGHASQEEITDKMLAKARLTRSQLNWALKVMTTTDSPISLDEVVTNDSDTGDSLSALLPDPNAIDPRDVVETEDRRGIIENALQLLDPASKKVVELHFGLNGSGQAMSMTGIATNLGLGREQVRSIINRGLRILRGTNSVRALAGKDVLAVETVEFGDQQQGPAQEGFDEDNETDTVNAEVEECQPGRPEPNLSPSPTYTMRPFRLGSRYVVPATKPTQKPRPQSVQSSESQRVRDASTLPDPAS